MLSAHVCVRARLSSHLEALVFASQYYPQAAKQFSDIPHLERPPLPPIKTSPSETLRILLPDLEEDTLACNI